MGDDTTSSILRSDHRVFEEVEVRARAYFFIRFPNAPGAQ